MQMPLKVLVLGATGNVGAPLVEELRRKKIPVRAAVRNIPEAARLRGVEYVEFDYFGASTHSRAFDGITSLYLLTPVIPDPAGLTVALVQAAKDAGVKKIVRQSAHGADRAFNVRLLRWHLESEKVIEDSGIPHVFLRPTGFFQNYLAYSEEISQAGVFHMALGSDRVAYIDARDVARVAAITLTEEGHEGRKYSLTGPQALSNEDIADTLSEITGDQIKYVPISDEVELRNLLADGTPPWLAEGIVELHRFWRGENAAQVLPTVLDLTGRDPIRFEQFAREFTSKFKRRAVA